MKKNMNTAGERYGSAETLSWTAFQMGTLKLAMAKVFSGI